MGPSGWKGLVDAGRRALQRSDVRAGLALFVAALLPRLIFNLALHPLDQNLTTDMGSYAKMSRALLLNPLEPNSWFAFWPYGTGWLSAIVQFIAGRENWDALGVLYAVFGAGVVVLGWDIARRVSPHAWIPPLVALFGVVYYPWIMMGGFVMSEPPFTFFLMVQAWAAVRWAQGGGGRDALLFGIAAALGLPFRPQMMVSVVLTLAVIGLAVVRERPRTLVHALAPIVLMLGLSSAYLAYNSGSPGFIAHNGSFNLVFGRCHNYQLTWKTKGGSGGFQPGGLLQVHRREEAAQKRGETYWLALDPAKEASLHVTSRPGDPGAMLDLVEECVRETGPVRQIQYSVTNVLMLWNGNVQFPSWGQDWSRQLDGMWRTIDQVLFQAPLLFALGFLAGPNRGLRVVAANAAALLLTAAVYFGEIRMRLPYAGLIVLLSFEVLAAAAGWVPWPASVRVSWARATESLRGLRYPN